MTTSGRPELIRVLIVDDEPLARQNLKGLLNNVPGLTLLGECSTGAEALNMIRSERPDLVFLDIQMPEMDGFQVLEQLEPHEIPYIIFVTAYDQYAIKAFEVHALDYLLKPFSDERFEVAVAQAKQHIAQRNDSQISRRLADLLDERERTGSSRWLSRFMIKSASRVFFLKAEDVDWIEAADYYVKLHQGKRAHLLRETMSDLETRLDPEKFFRIHRSTIVNLDRIREMHPHFNGEYLIIMEDGTELKLSRSRRELLQQRLGG